MNNNGSAPFGVKRRDFVKTTTAAAVALRAFAAAKPPQARVLGANDRINLGFIGTGGRANSLLREFQGIADKTGGVQIAAVCDVYEKRKRLASEKYKAKGYLDYREVINDPSIDAVVIATPDHWHARQSMEAMKAGKDVYLEKPMSRTVDEARQIYVTSVETKRVLQIGSQTTSADQWWKARKALQVGLIVKLLMR